MLGYAVGGRYTHSIKSNHRERKNMLIDIRLLHYIFSAQRQGPRNHNEREREEGSDTSDGIMHYKTVSSHLPLWVINEVLTYGWQTKIEKTPMLTFEVAKQ